MTNTQKIIHLIAAAVSVISAVILLWVTGLPSRAEFSWQMIPEIGAVAPEIDALAPPFQTTTLDGDTIDLLGLRGQTVVLNFWATWCAPCVVEMPILQSIHEDYAEQNVQIVGVNLGETPSLIQQWMDDNRFTFTVVPDETTTISQIYRLRGQPSTYIITPQGRISHIFYGPVRESVLRDIIAEQVQY